MLRADHGGSGIARILRFIPADWRLHPRIRLRFARDQPRRRLAPRRVVDPARPRLGDPACADVTASPKPAGDGYPIDYLIVDSQVNVAHESHYFRRSFRVSQSSGLQEAGEISFDFDPAYQTLQIHHLRVIRNGVTDDRLHLPDFEVIRQERDRERALYDGRLTAIAQLSDLRVGDIIDYAATVRGRNPVFAGHYFDSFGTTWALPVQFFRHRILMPTGRPLQAKGQGSSQVGPEVSEQDGFTVWNWEKSALTAVVGDADAPAWYPTYPYVDIGEFSQWSEVVAWALPLYDTALASAEPPSNEPRPVAALADEIRRQHATPEARALAAVRFVQEDVRYLGLELGAGSHRPRPPAATLASRFGDCKDKSLLLCALLRELGITSAPALVSTTHGQRLSWLLPSPLAFNHVITWLELPDGRQFWVDGTMPHLGGTLAHHASHDLGEALRILPGETAPRAMDLPPEARPSVTEIWTFGSVDFDQPTSLQIQTIYGGHSVPGVRSYLQSRTPDEVQRDYLNYVAGQHPGATVADPVRWQDDTTKNVLSTFESYQIPGFWKIDETTGHRTASVYPQSINGFLRSLDSPVRTTPLARAHPVNATVNYVIGLPDDWVVERFEGVVEDPFFRYTDQGYLNGRVLNLVYHYESRADVVGAGDVPAFAANLAKARDRLGFELTHFGAIGAAGFRLNGFTFWPVIMVSLTGLFLLWRLWSPARPPPATAEPPPIPPSAAPAIGGWLILLAFGLLARPTISIFQLFGDGSTYFNAHNWDMLAASEHGAAIRSLVVFEAVSHCLIFWIFLITARLFFTKRRLAPRWLIAGIVFSALFSAIDLVVALRFTDLASNAETLMAVIRNSLAALIWTPYLLLSQRVKNTFVR